MTLRHSFLYRTGCNLARDVRGAVSVYVAMGSILVLAFGALAVDVGRLAVLRNQMQSMADSVALAGANELDGAPGAQARATQAAFFALSKDSGLAQGWNGISPMQVHFLSSVSPEIAATSDDDSYFMRVELMPQLTNFFFTPFIRMMTGEAPGPWSDLALVQSTATAHREAIACNMPPFMVCDPTESNPSASLFDAANAGRAFRVKGGDGNGGFAPGQFGLICPGDDSNCGASAIGDALEAINPDYCVSNIVTTAPGQRMNQVRNGVNSRFDTAQGRNNPAPNVMNYPHDKSYNAEGLGGADWDRDAYWSDKHGGTLPLELDGASRFQVYLYELGESFARNGMQTVYPLGTTPLPPGFTRVEPPGKSIPVAKNPRDRANPDHDGVPQSAALQNPMRRVFTAAVLKCQADGVKGSGEYATRGRFVNLFFFRTAGTGSDASIYAEVIGGQEPDGPIGMFRSNPRLVQ